MNYYYICERIGTNSKSNPYRPDLDDGSPFVSEFGIDRYIVLTIQEQSPDLGRILLEDDNQLRNACEEQGISYDDVVGKWYIAE